MGILWQKQYAYSYKMNLQPWEPGYDKEYEDIITDEQEFKLWKLKSEEEKFQEWKLLREAVLEHKMSTIQYKK